MTRVKGAVNALKTRRNVLKRTKGYKFGRSTKEADAYPAMVHAGVYSFAHRKDKKGDFRKLWTVRINSALDDMGYSYSKFIGNLKKNKIELDRKVLSQIASDSPEVFKTIAEKVMR